MKNKTNWEEDFRLASKPSQTTHSGKEVVFDPEYIIEKIYFLLADREREMVEGIERLRKEPDCSENKEEACTPICGFNRAIWDIIKYIKD